MLIMSLYIREGKKLCSACNTALWIISRTVWPPRVVTSPWASVLVFIYQSGKWMLSNEMTTLAVFLSYTHTKTVFFIKTWIYLFYFYTCYILHWKTPTWQKPVRWAVVSLWVTWKPISGSLTLIIIFFFKLKKKIKKYYNRYSQNII